MPLVAKNIAAAALAVALTLGSAPTMAFEVIKASVSVKSGTPEGTWQTKQGDARFRVSLCGDGTQLCAKLTWLRKDARSEENLRYLNKYVLRNAEAIEANKWRGTVNYQGETVSGSVTLAGNVMNVLGCKGVFCQLMEFRRL